MYQNPNPSGPLPPNMYPNPSGPLPPNMYPSAPIQPSAPKRNTFREVFLPIILATVTLLIGLFVGFRFGTSQTQSGYCYDTGSQTLNGSNYTTQYHYTCGESPLPQNP